MGLEERRNWYQYDYWQSTENRNGKPFSLGVSKEDEQGMSVDYWLNSRERTVDTLNLPALILVGWYSHPLGVHSSSVLGPVLLRLTAKASVKARVVVLDATLLAAIGLQWWLIGRWIERSGRLARVAKAIAVTLTVLGIIMVVAAVATSLTAGGQFKLIVDAISLIVYFGWVPLAATGILNLVLAVVNVALRRAPKGAVG